MGTRTFCDGCNRDVPPDKMVERGRYDKMTYDPDCVALYDAFVAAEQAKRVELVRAFESWREAAIAKLKASGLNRLPDEG